MSIWREVELNTLSEVIDSLHKTPKYSDHGYPMVRVTDVKDGYLKLDNTFKVDESVFQEFTKKHKPTVGDIVMTRVGTYGNVSYVREGDSFCLGQNTVVIVPNEHVNSKFLYYTLQSKKIKDQIEAQVGGSTQKTISLKSIRSLKIEVPDKLYQDRIASILGTLDDKKYLNTKMNKTIEDIAMALYKHWFVDFGPFQDGDFVESELGLIPKGWNVVKLNDVAGVNKNNIKSDYPYEKIRYIDISSVNEGSLEGYTVYSLSDAPSRAKRLVKSGDIIWSTVRPNRKSFLYIHNPYANTVVSTGFAVLTPIKIPSTFLYLHVITNQFVSYLVNNSKGSAYPAVNASTFKDAKLSLPPKKVLDDFNELVFPLIKLKNETETENVKLELMRDYLLPKLLSGEIHLKQKKR